MNELTAVSDNKHERPDKPMRLHLTKELPARFPNCGRFAFTILDDTDDSTVENAKPIYDLLKSLGMRTTKTAWPLDCPPAERGIYFAGSTMQDATYLDWVKSLVSDGFELASHNASMASSKRPQTIEGLKFFLNEFGQAPRLHCNHGQNRENLYWGAARFRHPLYASPLRLLSRKTNFEGEIESSPYFWGDIAQSTFDFVRSFAFRTLNLDTLPINSPYMDESTPWVRRWFISSDAPDATAFKRLVNRNAINKLCHLGGYTIISTHLGKGFVRAGKVDKEVEDILRYVASLPGWFPTVSELLDFRLNDEDAGRWITSTVRLRLETSHLFDRIADRLFSP
jgi:hypothetical protein